MRDADLRDADLRDANLSGANLNGADLSGADLNNATLNHANLGNANLLRVNLYVAVLRHVHLNNAHLEDANLNGANLRDANLTNATFSETIFADTNLTGVIGLETCVHTTSSVIDHRTLQGSGPLPISFLRGVGLPERLINYLPTLLNQAFEHQSCFISYSTKDQQFAERIHADLQDRGVRCWFAPHDMPIGGKILDEIHGAIQLRDKLLLILSEHSMRNPHEAAHLSGMMPPALAK